MDVYGYTIEYRYEPEFHTDGSTDLIGKKIPTSVWQRAANIYDALETFEDDVYTENQNYDMFDEYLLRRSSD